MALKLAAVEGTALLAGTWVSAAAVRGAAPGLEAAFEVIAFALCTSLSLAWTELLDLRRVRTLRSFCERLPGAMAWLLAFLVGLYGVVPAARMPEQALLASLGAVPLVLLPLRAFVYRVLRSRPFAERVVILGASSLGRRLVAEIAARPDAYLELVGFVDDGDEPDAQPTCRRLGSLAELDAIVERTRPDRVVVAMTARRGQLPVGKLLELRLRGVRVEEGCDLHERLAGQLVIECLPPASLVFCPDFRQSRVQLAAARALGVLGAVTGLVLLSPVLLLVALAIRLESPGPVLFVQRRLGLHGKPFALVKLRTMRVTGKPHSEWVRDNGDRITPLGRWLRRFRVDELPQLWNVLRGDMNLVGPRPHPVSNHELFRERIPYYAFRLAVRPGITGWAQVRYGYANDLEQETEKTRYDLYYVKHFSLALDLWILWETVGVVLFGRGADAVTAARGEAALGAR